MENFVFFAVIAFAALVLAALVLPGNIRHYRENERRRAENARKYAEKLAFVTNALNRLSMAFTGKTRDNILTEEVIEVDFVVADSYRFLELNDRPQDALLDIVKAAVRAEVAGNNSADLLDGRSDLTARVEAAVRQQTRHVLGIDIRSVSFTEPAT